jgi:hypothetical protein
VCSLFITTITIPIGILVGPLSLVPIFCSLNFSCFGCRFGCRGGGG